MLILLLLSFNLLHAFLLPLIRAPPEIYRIVSNKALEANPTSIKPTGGETITVAPTGSNTPAKGGCC